MYILGFKSDPTWMRVVNSVGAVSFTLAGLIGPRWWPFGVLASALLWIAIYLPIAYMLKHVPTR